MIRFNFLSQRFVISIFVIVLISFGCRVSAQTVSLDYVEMDDPTEDKLADWSNVTKGIQASFVSIDKRFPRSLPPTIDQQSEESLTGWKGERVFAQVLLWSSEDSPSIRVEISSLKNGNDGLIPVANAKANFVRYVMTDEFASGCGHRKPEDFKSSLSPDVLDNTNEMELDAKQVRPVWISINIPNDAKPGKYNGKITVSQGSSIIKELPLNLEVINQVLPEPSQWKFHLDQWQHPSAVARVSNAELWSDEHFEAMKPIMKMLADAGQKVITATLNKDPWNVQTFDPYADMIVWTKNEDGRFDYDFTIFDRWVQFMMDLGVKDMINCYSLIPWNNEIHYKDAKTQEFVDVVAKHGVPEFEQYWKGFLIEFVRHLRNMGWLEITNIALDERSSEEIDAAIKLLKDVAPELGVSYADNQKTYQRYPDSEDISISASHPFSEEDLNDRTRRGLNTTFYVCCSDAFPNQFTFSAPAESTYLAWYAEAAKFNGMLRWAYNSWVKSPLLDSRFRTWPAGDTYIVYPDGRSSIRYERMLEGIQDYEKIQIVKEKLIQSDQLDKLEVLEKAIAKLNTVERTATWNQDLNDAKEVLNSISKSI